MHSFIIKHTPYADMDKKLFLCELLKLLAHADIYFKTQKFVAFYNTAITITFLCV